MSEISNNNVLSNLSINAQQNTNEAEAERNELGQTAFLELMITQMENQNPLNPQENSEFVAQLAQFSSVEGIDRLNNSFDDFSANFLSNQALQASSLVGSSVAVPTDKAQLVEGGVVSGMVNIPASTGDLKINVYDQRGVLLESIDVGTQPAGDAVFRWDGNRLEFNGELTDWESSQPIASGDFLFKVFADQNGDNTELDLALSANVNSVTLDGNNKMILNLAGLGAVPLSEVRQFN